MRHTKFITVVPSTIRFWWEVAILLDNFREFNYSGKANILVFQYEGKENIEKWKILEEKFPETSFFYYEDKHRVHRMINAFDYSPIIRPYCLREHFKIYKGLEDDAIFYHDSDILFTKKLDFSILSGDDISYLSWTGNTDEEGKRYGNYLNSEYFDSKKKDVIEEKKSLYEKIDVLGELLDMFTLPRGDVENKNTCTGGAQYLLKNINSDFWNDVLEGCIFIRMYLKQTNQRFFESEDKGFQSWCADMWSVLWTLWKTEHRTYCPPILDFLWATDSINKWTTHYIYHNAGITSDSKFKTGRGADKKEIESPAFYKGKYTTSTPFEDEEYLLSIINNPLSKQFANAKYAEAILNTKNHLSL